MPPVYPPILANVCLTRLKPFKDAAHARTESERIGNNYRKVDNLISVLIL